MEVRLSKITSKIVWPAISSPSFQDTKALEAVVTTTILMDNELKNTQIENLNKIIHSN